MAQFDQADLDNRFGYHPPSATEIVEAHQSLRTMLRAVSGIMVALVPAGRELALALTSLEEAMMWANAGIARTQQVGSPEAFVSAMRHLDEAMRQIDQQG